MSARDVGILGGTGPAGRGLALRLAASGMKVTIGSRDPARAADVAEGLRSRWPDHELHLAGAGNPEAAACQTVVVATPWDAAAATAGALREGLAGKVVVSMANALTRSGDELIALVPPRGSIAEAVQAATPGARVAGAFHHLPAAALADLGKELDADVLVCSDNAEATGETVALVESIAGLRAYDAGSLSSCGAVEAFTAVLVGLNIRYRARASLRLTGVRKPS
ncbi:MAG: NADPH-dependent F420 reductase [Actinomycetota bacterium]|nr:NADPH-dependent F420 reductase [Actinomycetota bacterium]